MLRAPLESILPWWKKSKHPSIQMRSSRIDGAGSPGGISSMAMLGLDVCEMSADECLRMNVCEYDVLLTETIGMMDMYSMRSARIEITASPSIRQINRFCDLVLGRKRPQLFAHSLS